MFVHTLDNKLNLLHKLNIKQHWYPMMKFGKKASINKKLFHIKQHKMKKTYFTSENYLNTAIALDIAFDVFKYVIFNNYSICILVSTSFHVTYIS